jgi:ABC-type lipoprotein release transport system permease subunit
VTSGVWWRIAWRNLWRNRRRTLITASALAFGFLAAVVLVALSQGMIGQMVENGTGLVTGQVQVHDPEWEPERSLYATIGGDDGTDVAALVAQVVAAPGVTAAAPRVYGGGLVSAGRRTSAGILMGIDMALEPGVSRLLGEVSQGRVPRAGAHEIAIGAEMARKLEVGPGDEVVLVAPAADGSLGNDLYTVSGVFHTGLTELDGAWALLPLDRLQALLALDPGRVHEVAAAVEGPWQAPAIAERLAAEIGRGGLAVDVRPWTTFRPELADYARLANSFYGVVIAIVFFMAIFGVANTMLMATFERRREFAVVRALGTPPSGVAGTVVIEGLILGLLALAAGAAVTFPLLAWWARSPLDLSEVIGGFSAAGSYVRPILEVEVTARWPAFAALALLLTSILAAVYPAWRSARVPPADALSGR